MKNLRLLVGIHGFKDHVFNTDFLESKADSNHRHLVCQPTNTFLQPFCVS